MGNINGFIESWMSHRKALLELLDTLDDKHLDFKPWEGGMSLSDLVLHISGAMGMFVNTVNNGIFTPPVAPKSFESIKELKGIVEEDTQLAKSTLEALSEEQLTKIIEFYGMKMPGMVLLESAKEHEIHHKGQLFTYARLLGLEKLPFFVSR